jgi:hypothetical protein
LSTALLPGFERPKLTVGGLRRATREDAARTAAKYSNASTPSRTSPSRTCALTSQDAERNRRAVIWQSRGQGFESPQLHLYPLPLRLLFLQLNRPDRTAGLIKMIVCIGGARSTGAKLERAVAGFDCYRQMGSSSLTGRGEMGSAVAASQRPRTERCQPFLGVKGSQVQILSSRRSDGRFSLSRTPHVGPY